MELKKSHLPLISVITVVYNAEEFLEDTILSVLNQDYKNIEFLIIDGGSSDSTIDIIEKYIENIDVFISEEDNGIYDAMNKGINLAKGDWINFLNAGDCFYKKEVLKSIFTTDLSNLWFLYGKVNYFSNEFNISNIFGKEIKINNLQTSFPICHQSMFFNKKVFNRLGNYNLNYLVTSDYDLTIKIFKDDSIIKKFYDVTISSFLIDGYGFNNSIKAHWEKVKVIDSHFKFFAKFQARIKFSITVVRISILNLLKILKLHNFYRFIKYELILSKEKL